MPTTAALLMESPVPAPATRRLETLDVGKGVGILLIVLGHNALFVSEHGNLNDFIRSFNLPFFFFVSGVTFVLGTRSLKTVAWMRADALLKPCAVVIVLAGMLRVLSGAGGVEEVLLGLLFGTGFTLLWTPIWFLPHLWLLNVSTAILLRHGVLYLRTWARRIGMLLLLAAAGYLVLLQFDSTADNPACLRMRTFTAALFDCGLPFSADLLLLTGVFFLLGHFLANRVRLMRHNWMLLSLVCAATLALHHFLGYTIDFNQRRYDSLLISTLQALCGIYMMLSVCSLLLSCFAPVGKVLSYLGRGSLFILIFHGSLMLKLEAWLPRWIDHAYLAVALAMAISVALSLMLWELSKRSRIGTLLMLPRKLRPQENSLPRQGGAGATS